MHKKTCLKQSFFLLTLLFLMGCTGSKPKVTKEQMIGMMDLPSYHVEDSSGTLILPVADLIFDHQSGEIDYIAVEAPPSGFDLDIRTAPYHSNQVILIPWQLANLEMEKNRFMLKVEVHDLTGAPRFSLPVAAFPGNWREAVERYWNPISG